MYIEGDSSLDDSSIAELANGERMRRYSVIGNDPAFQQYTKNHDYDSIKFTDQSRGKVSLD